MTVVHTADPTYDIPHVEQLWFPLWDTRHFRPTDAPQVAEYFQNPAGRPQEEVNLYTAGSVTWPKRLHVIGLEVTTDVEIKPEDLPRIKIKLTVGPTTFFYAGLDAFISKEDQRIFYSVFQPLSAATGEEDLEQFHKLTKEANNEKRQNKERMDGVVYIPPVTPFCITVATDKDCGYMGAIQVTMLGVLTRQIQAS